MSLAISASTASFKGPGNNLLVELLYIEVEFIVQQFAVGDLSGHRIVDSDGIAGLIVNAFIPQFGMEIVGAS